MTSDVSSTTTDAVVWSTRSDETARQGILWVYPEQRFDLISERPANFGRAPECEYTINDTQVSRIHASAQLTPAGCELRDSSSRNGTFVNGQRTLTSLLSEQDVVRMGGWVGLCISLFTGEEPLTRISPGVIVGSRAFAVYRQAMRAAQSPLPIIISGETGTGKEVLSKTLHRASARSGPFVAVNCAALPESLAEGELFGYRKGAFTGANKSHPGYFRTAHHGTLLLDEIADLSPSIQAKLLRVLEERAVVPIGESMPTEVDVRVLAAGQGALSDAVSEGRFRADLYSRLRGVELVLPPLAQRREEVVPIFLTQVAESLSRGVPALSPEFVERLCTYDWPLNIREVVQVARQMTVLYPDRDRWSARFLPESLRTASPPDAMPVRRTDPNPEVHPAPAIGYGRPRAHGDRSTPGPGAQDRREQASRARSAELERLLEALAAHDGNVSRAAAALGISRQRAYRLLEQRPELDLNRLRYPR